ncbi:hypothetical protein LWI29_016259 [Acer saccharum]|uniref:CCHC-type domain-containing protein n=1 Tax=Acer saccharum TaxID=4024 RepID=A0AA39W6H2_ACESA|nr:hypothetical protein LWI29_016259 [Acer saccharum]
MDIKLGDRVHALILLGSLPESCETIVVALSHSAPGGNLKLKMVKDGVLNEENRRKEQGFVTQSQALVTKNRGRSKSRTPRNRDNDDRSRGRSKSRKEISCFHCGKAGHKKFQCRKFKREQNNEKGEEKKKGIGHVATTADGDVCIFMEHDSVNLTCQNSHWVVDSGASYHVTSHRDYFSSYIGGQFGHVKMGNDVECKVVGMGDVWVNADVGCKLLLKNVRHVPDIRLNLISIGSFDDEGYSNHFSEGKWKLTKGSLVVAKGKKFSSLYMIYATPFRGEVNTVDDSSTELWHMRLGHLSENGMRILAKKQLLPGLKDQTIEDFDKPEKPKPVNDELIPVPIPPPPVHVDDMGDVQGDVQGDHFDANDAFLDPRDGVEADEQVGENPTEQHLETQLRRSTRERQPSTRYHWIRDVLEMKLLQIEKIHTDDNGSDMMTKALPKEKLAVCRDIAVFKIQVLEIPDNGRQQGLQTHEAEAKSTLSTEEGSGHYQHIEGEFRLENGGGLSSSSTTPGPQLQLPLFTTQMPSLSLENTHSLTHSLQLDTESAI